MAKCKDCKNLEMAITSDNEYICNWCEKIHDDPDEERERECEYYEVMTNADRIRNMTDEELAEFLEKTVRDMGDNMFKCENQSLEKCMDCKECYLAWLKSEVRCDE